MVIATIFGFGSGLRKGKVLAPLTSVVLNGNLLVLICVSSVNLCLFVIFGLLESIIDMGEDLRRGKGRFFISVLAKIQQSPAYVSLWCK